MKKKTIFLLITLLLIGLAIASATKQDSIKNTKDSITKFITDKIGSLPDKEQKEFNQFNQEIMRIYEK